MARSLAGDRLDAADPAWVARLARGLWMEAAASAITVACLVPAVGDALYASGDVDDPNVGGWLAFLAPLALGVIGTWLLTTREPGVWREPLGPTLRLLLRWGVVTEAALTLVNSGISSPPLGTDSVWLQSFAPLSLGLAVMVVWWVYVWRILARIPRPGLVLTAQFVLVGNVVCVVARDWLPWPMMWAGWFDASFAVSTSRTVRFADVVLGIADVVVVALAARAVGDVAAKLMPEAPDEGGAVRPAARKE